MDEALQFLRLARLEQSACSLNVRLLVQFSRRVGMIEATGQMIDGGGAIDGLLHLLCVGDLALHDLNFGAKLFACFLCVAY